MVCRLIHGANYSTVSEPLYGEPNILLYLTEEWGIAWDLREMGSTWGGNEGGSGPPDRQQDKLLTASKEGDNSAMEQEEDERKSQTS
jgi:hypothetical protein